VTVLRSPAPGIALLCALSVAGCGLGPGSSVGDVRITVTRDYGSQVLLRRSEPNVRESETALRLLDRNADISTRYGGGFVQSIDGLAGANSGNRRFDWFFYVDGVESPVGSADYPLHGGYRVWWDYRDWTAAMRVPAVVGSYPEPFLNGYEGKRHPVQVRCLGGGPACGLASARLRDAGAEGGKSSADPIRVLVGPWKRVRSDAAAALIERGPAESGVFADFVRAAGAWELQPLNVAGLAAGAPRRAALVAATRDGDNPPTWVVTGSNVSDATAAARLLDAADLRDRYAVATLGGHSMPLPVR
jgi:Domain of unknown function (DUF4430)